MDALCGIGFLLTFIGSLFLIGKVWANKGKIALSIGLLIVIILAYYEFRRRT